MEFVNIIHTPLSFSLRLTHIVLPLIILTPFLLNHSESKGTNLLEEYGELDSEESDYVNSQATFKKNQKIILPQTSKSVGGFEGILSRLHQLIPQSQFQSKINVLKDHVEKTGPRSTPTSATNKNKLQESFWGWRRSKKMGGKKKTKVLPISTAMESPQEKEGTHISGEQVGSPGGKFELKSRSVLQSADISISKNEKGFTSSSYLLHTLKSIFASAQKSGGKLKLGVGPSDTEGRLKAFIFNKFISSPTALHAPSPSSSLTGVKKRPGNTNARKRGKPFKTPFKKVTAASKIWNPPVRMGPESRYDNGTLCTQDAAFCFDDGSCPWYKKCKTRNCVTDCFPRNGLDWRLAVRKK